MDVLPLQQSPAYGRALTRLGRSVRDRTAPGGRMLIVARGFGCCFRGPRWGTEAMADRVALLRKVGPRVVAPEGECDGVMRRAGYRQVVTGGTVAILPRDAAISSKWRAALPRARGLRLAACRFDPVRHADLLRAEGVVQRAKGYRGLPRAFLRAFGCDLDVFTAESAGEIVAAMFFVRHPPTATYILGWSGAEGRRLHAHHALLDFARRDLPGTITHLDLGQIDTVNAPGLARFKLSAGAVPHRLGGTWLRIPGL